MLVYGQNSDFVATSNVDATSLEVVDFNSGAPIDNEMIMDAFNCCGTFGTLGSAGGCFGSFGTFGCG